MKKKRTAKKLKKTKPKPAKRKLRSKRAMRRTAPKKKPKPKKRPLKRRFMRKQLKVYKEKLLNLKEDLLNQIKDISQDTLMKSQKELSGDISGYTLHIADVATDNYEREFNIGLVAGERKILMEVDAALKRVEEGTYGICEQSGKPISKTRLNAIPYARYTIKVKEQLEKENRI